MSKKYFSYVACTGIFLLTSTALGAERSFGTGTGAMSTDRAVSAEMGRMGSDSGLKDPEGLQTAPGNTDSGSDRKGTFATIKKNDAQE